MEHTQQHSSLNLWFYLRKEAVCFPKVMYVLSVFMKMHECFVNAAILLMYNFCQKPIRCTRIRSWFFGKNQKEKALSGDHLLSCVRI